MTDVLALARAERRYEETRISILDELIAAFRQYYQDRDHVALQRAFVRCSRRTGGARSALIRARERLQQHETDNALIWSADGVDQS